MRDIVAVYRQLLFWFPIREHYAALRDMPAFVWDVGGDQRGFVHLDGFYGFPAIDGPGGGVKVASESYEHTTTPTAASTRPSPSETERMYRGCVQPYLPWLGEVPLRTVSCLYTSTRGSRFIIDRHPEHDVVLVVSACSGHGFKHSPAIGEAVAQWVTGQAPRHRPVPVQLRGGAPGALGGADERRDQGHPDATGDESRHGPPHEPGTHGVIQPPCPALVQARGAGRA